jgi:hypothetical protein
MKTIFTEGESLRKIVILSTKCLVVVIIVASFSMNSHAEIAPEQLAATNIGADSPGVLSRESPPMSVDSHLISNFSYVQDANSSRPAPEQLAETSMGADSFSVISRSPLIHVNQSTLDPVLALQ